MYITFFRRFFFLVSFWGRLFFYICLFSKFFFLRSEISMTTRSCKANHGPPASQLFMTGFMLWMSGAGVHIFSIMITGMALLNPLKAIANTGEVFKRFKAPRGARLNLLPMKLTYIAIQLVAFSMGIWKINKMGLLPLTSADWSASMLQLRNFQETSVHITNDL